MGLIRRLLARLATQPDDGCDCYVCDEHAFQSNLPWILPFLHDRGWVADPGYRADCPTPDVQEITVTLRRKVGE